jgi:tetratricopeptide (TPR) repeat protein
MTSEKRNNRCFGITNTILPLCKRRGDWLFLCPEHKIKTPFGIVGFLITVISIILGLRSCILPSDESLYRRALSYKESSQDEKALKLFQKLYLKNPDYPNVAYLYGGCLIKKGDNKEAISVLESVPSNEKHIDIEFNKGWLYYGLGNENKARECINKSLLDLTVNDNRYYLAISLLTFLLNKNQGINIFKSETDKFCDLIDGLIFSERHVNISNKYGSYPSTELLRSLNKLASLRSAAYFILSKLMDAQINQGQYQGSLDSFNKLTQYIQEPSNIYINITEDDFLKNLTQVSVALSRLYKGNFVDYQIVDESLLSIERHNINTCKSIYELSCFIRKIYFNKNDEYINNTAFAVKYDKILTSNKPIYQLKIESPEYLIGNKLLSVNGIYQYRYTNEILIPINKHIHNYYFNISVCEFNGIYSKSEIIYPYIKVIKH